MKRYYIFQMPVSNGKVFCHYDPTVKVDLDEYVPVYTGIAESEDDPIAELERLFTEFNCTPPKGFAGRSLSVSDVIEFVDEDTRASEFYYCDWIGFERLDGKDNFRAG